MSLKKKRIFLAVLGIMLVFLSGCGKSEDKAAVGGQAADKEGDTVTLPDGTVIRSDGTVDLAMNSCYWGMFDVSGNILNGYDLLSVNNDVIAGTIVLGQNLEREETEYTLIILVDYEQKSFSVNGQTYSDYRFTLDAQDSIDIDFELACPENAKILTGLIIFEPQLRELSVERFGEFCSTAQHFYSMSCRLGEYQYDESEYEFCTEFHTTDFNSETIYMSKDLEERKPMPACESGGDVNVFIGNGGRDVEETYVMLAFLDWKQSPIEGEPYKLLKIAGDKVYRYGLTVPEVKEAAPYQLFMLENPFRHAGGDYFGAANRTIIYPKY